MVDFKEQLEKGLSAYRQASAARQEIESVLRNFSAQIEYYTNNIVGIILKEDTASRVAGVISNLAKLGSKPVSYNKQYSIVAIDKSENSEQEEYIATWQQSDTGYPCVVTFSNSRNVIYDREALENTLGDLLASPDTGRAISLILSAATTESNDTTDAGFGPEV